MAVVKKPDEKPHIDLTGQDGNAFALLGHAKNLARQLGIDVKSIIADMTSGNYEHLVEVFDRHFGDYVDLWR